MLAVKILLNLLYQLLNFHFLQVIRHFVVDILIVFKSIIGLILVPITVH